MSEKRKFGDRLKHAWSIFKSSGSESEPVQTSNTFINYGVGSTYRPDRARLRMTNERTIITSMYNRIAIDVAAVPIKHVRIDQNGRYLETIKSGLNECLSLSANIDQTGRELILDTVLSMFDEGVVAIVPVETSDNYLKNGTFDIHQLRTASVLEWYPSDVKLSIYNDKVGSRQEIVLPKDKVAIIENPLYSVMNAKGSTIGRLVRKLALLDVIDEHSGSSKLDLILQLPYTVKTEKRKEEAEKRKKQIEEQLKESTYGIAYVDSTEKITQLNRSLENNLLNQVEYLTSMLYSQLGITQEVFDGKADEKMMLNYYNRTIEPILSAIVDEMMRKFLTKTARTQGQSLMFIRDPFRLVAVGELAEIADKFSRNEILTGNELRGIVGFLPSEQESADELRNKNLNNPMANVEESNEEYYQQQEQDMEDMLAQLDELENSLGLENEDVEDEDAITHYASPYYDPVKAHEYYERTKELTGRKSTSGLNEEGRKAAKYVKSQLDEEKKTKISESKEALQSKINNFKKVIRDLNLQKTDTKHKITSASQRRQIASQIYNIRKQIATLKNSVKNEQKNIKNTYENKYVSELDSIRSEGSFKQVKKSKKSSNK